MSTAPHLVSADNQGIASAALAHDLPVAVRPRSAMVVKRRLDLHRGRALEQLGHAIEYVLDNGARECSRGLEPVDLEAVQILKRLSREVFEECPEVVSAAARLCSWFRGKEDDTRASYGGKRHLALSSVRRGAC